MSKQNQRTPKNKSNTMELDIISLKQNWKVSITPVLDRILFPTSELTIANYFLNIEFTGKLYQLPYEIVFSNDCTTILDEDEKSVGVRPVIKKERIPNFNLFAEIKKNSSDADFHVVSQTVCLLSTYEECKPRFEVQIGNLLPEIDSHSFYLEKDNHFSSNSNILFAISNDVFTKDLIYCPDSYFPLNCIIYLQKDVPIIYHNFLKVAFKGLITDCEDLLFNSEKLTELRRSVLKKQENQEKIDGDADNFNYFHRGGWEDDYNFFMRS